VLLKVGRKISEFSKALRVALILCGLPMIFLSYLHSSGRSAELQNSVLLGHDAASLGGCVPTFRDNVVLSSSVMEMSIRLGHFYLEDETNTLSRKVEKRLSRVTTSYSKGMESLSTLLQQPENYIQLFCSVAVTFFFPWENQHICS
jgi:hypothetical protein